MADRKRNALVFITLLIGASGLGIGVYSLIKLNQQDSSDSKVVAVWETLTGIGFGFFLNFSNNQLDQNEYFSLSEGNTTITLTQIGWYRITFTFVLIDLDPTNWYQLLVTKNGVSEASPFYLEDPPAIYWTVNAICFVFSDGNDHFKFMCQSESDSFSLTSNQVYNQLVLEYVEVI